MRCYITIAMSYSDIAPASTNFDATATTQWQQPIMLVATAQWGQKWPVCHQDGTVFMSTVQSFSTC